MNLQSNNRMIWTMLILQRRNLQENQSVVIIISEVEMIIMSSLDKFGLSEVSPTSPSLTLSLLSKLYNYSC